MLKEVMLDLKLSQLEIKLNFNFCILIVFIIILLLLISDSFHILNDFAFDKRSSKKWCALSFHFTEFFKKPRELSVEVK